MAEFEYSSGSLCLDLANTWGDRADPGDDGLKGYLELLDWAHGAELVSDRERGELEKLAPAETAKSSGVFQTALELRETVFRLCSSVAAGEQPAERDLAALNVALQTVPRQRLCCGGECCEWEWPEGETEFRRILWPVIQSAADLVSSADAARIHECDAPDCNWLFLDRSRGGRRRWCDMSICGNRAKARRYYDRHQRNT